MPARAAGIAAACLLMVLPAVFGCEEKIKPSVLSNVDSRTLPQQESWNSTVTLSDSGVVTAVIEAGYIRVYDQPPRTLLSEGVKVHFLDADGRETSVLTSREGQVNDQTNDLEASGDVVVVSKDSTVLSTTRLYWDSKKNLIHTPDYVSIVSPRERIQGRGFEADQNLRSYRIFKVTGQADAK